MNPFSIVAALLKALAAYWSLKAGRLQHDLREVSRNRIETLQDELAKLRNDGTPESALAADKLRDRLLTEQEYFEHLPGSRPEYSGWHEDPDEDRDLSGPAG